MKNQQQQQPMPLHDVSTQSLCPNPLAETQILSTPVTQSSPVNEFEVQTYVFTLNHCNGHILIFMYMYIKSLLSAV